MLICVEGYKRRHIILSQLTYDSIYIGRVRLSRSSYTNKTIKCSLEAHSVSSTHNDKTKMTSYNVIILFAIVAFVNSEIVNFEECTYPEGK